MTETMTEVAVEEYETIPVTIKAVEYDGDTHTARALIEHGWLDGCAVGFDRNGSHEVLRGMVAEAVVYPGDLIIHFEDGSAAVMPGDEFDAHYQSTGHTEKLETDTTHIAAGEGIEAEAEPLGVEAITIQDPTNPEPDEVTAMKKIPSGENPDAVNLESSTGGPQEVDDEDEDEEDDEDLEDEDEEDDEE